MMVLMETLRRFIKWGARTISKVKTETLQFYWLAVLTKDFAFFCKYAYSGFTYSVWFLVNRVVQLY